MARTARALGRSRIAVAATFSAQAIVIGTVGPWIPRLKADSGLDAGGLGVALGGYAAGLILGTRIVGPVLRRAGARRPMRLGVPLQAVALAALPIADGLGELMAIFAVLGIASGGLDVAMNAEAVAVERRAGRRLMSGMHGVWSVSMLIGAGLAAIALAAEVPIDVYLPALGACLVLASFPLLRWLLPSAGAEPDLSDPSERSSSRPSSARVAVLCLIAFASFQTEGIAAEWSAVYLSETLGAAAGLAGLGVVAFSAGMASSRFVGDRLATLLGAQRVARAGTALAAVVLALALLFGGPVSTVGALVVVGMGVGPTVPLTFAAAGRLVLGPQRTALNIVVTAGYVGSIVGPLLVGSVAELVNLRAAFVVPVLWCAVAAAAAGALRERRAGAGTGAAS